MADGPRQPSGCPCDGEPHLALSLRARDRRDPKRLWDDGRAADASRTARLAGHGIHGERLEHQTHPPANYAFEHVSPSRETCGGGARIGPGPTGRPLQRPALEVPRPALGRRGRPGRGAICRRSAESHCRRPQRLSSFARGRAQTGRWLERDQVVCRPPQAQCLCLRPQEHAPTAARDLRFPGHSRILR